MLDIAAFSECIRANLKDRRSGKERSAKIIKDFEDKANFYKENGKNTAEAGTQAMRDVFDRMSFETAEKAKRTAKTLSVLAEAGPRIQEGFKAKGVFGGKGKALGHAVKSIILPDKRFTGLNLDTDAKVRLGHAYAVWGEDADKILKGAFGIQKGKAHLPNIIREVFGQNTGDINAKALAQGWLRTADFLVDEFNAAGGSMRKLKNYLPQKQSAVKLIKNGADGRWVSEHMKWLDWNSIRRDDGTLIPEGERQKVLEFVYETLSTDGANKIDPNALRGQGRSIGNALEEHRFLHYKDSESWLAAHEKYADGNIFDVLNHHIGAMTHRAAVVNALGPNPELAMKSMQRMAEKAALDAKIGADEILEMKGVFKNVVDAGMERVLHTNPMNPESTMANISGISQNITTAAMMGKAAIASSLGDPTTTAIIRRFNGLPMFNNMRLSIESLRSSVGDVAGQLGVTALDRDVGRNIALTSGWIHDSSLSHTSTIDRFNSAWNMPNSVTRRVADDVLRASGMNIMTNRARFAARGEMAAYMFRTSAANFDELPYKAMLQRYGITAEDWNAFRSIESHNPAPGIHLLRPIDILKSDLPKGINKDKLFRKFQSMVLSEGNGMVPDSTVEAAITLKGNTRPDTIPGLILNSFSMFKNFPITYMQMYSQYAMSLPTARGRLGFVAGLTAATTLAGSMAVQLGELQAGRDPIDMTRGDFWVKAALKGGGLGYYGDLLFSAVDQMRGGATQQVAGPSLGLMSDTVAIAAMEANDAFQAYSEGGWDGLYNYDSKGPKRLVDYMHRYFPGSNLWMTQQLANKMVWEHIEDAADPKATQRRQRLMDQQKKSYGNEYYYRPGEATPSRGPDLSKALGSE